MSLLDMSVTPDDRTRGRGEGYDYGYDQQHGGDDYGYGYDQQHGGYGYGGYEQQEHGGYGGYDQQQQQQQQQHGGYGYDQGPAYDPRGARGPAPPSVAYSRGGGGFRADGPSDRPQYEPGTYPAMQHGGRSADGFQNTNDEINQRVHAQVEAILRQQGGKMATTAAPAAEPAVHGGAPAVAAAASEPAVKGGSGICDSCQQKAAPSVKGGCGSCGAHGPGCTCHACAHSRKYGGTAGASVKGGHHEDDRSHPYYHKSDPHHRYEHGRSGPPGGEMARPGAYERSRDYGGAAGGYNDRPPPPMRGAAGYPPPPMRGAERQPYYDGRR